MKTCAGFCVVNPIKNFPVDGSFSLFQEVEKLRLPDLLLNPRRIPGKRYSSPFLSSMTKFPLSKRSAAGEPLDDTEIFVDQTAFRFSSTSCRFPLLVIVKLANASVTARGLSRLATHTTFRGSILLCHIPTYLLPELLGLKNPNSKMRPGETRVLPCANGCREVML
ncbi:G-type lectin S-receptor-like serine/threonine-protein kinase [Pyrus ussuriensis x Pyrus communis]|uniref:G-type lectin S-receptor-like serine/threonine-protein kinase n=1 Tax=Pyrus ussuriensis x Pyrus communis TaxID=2448454 RepID=A0A5N5ICH4_9ROSA|nr:G-type lectin S-receptor-like serine/threonine-protein kinase [Pyrus ussuriensis x Pyrus communis]